VTATVTMREGKRGVSPAAAAGGLVAWAEESGRRRAGVPVQGGLRFAVYGRVSTEDWQDPVTSRARQHDLWGSRTRPLALTWASMRPARTR